MAGVDTLLGTGAEAALSKRLEQVGQIVGSAAELVFGDDAPTVEARWTIDGEQVGRVKFQFRNRDTIVWTSLQVVPAFQQRGIYTGLLQRLHTLFQEYGVTTYLAYPRDEMSSYVLRLLGFQSTEEPNEIAIADVGPNDRMSEYVAWKAGGDEPSWHRAMKADS